MGANNVKEEHHQQSASDTNVLSKNQGIKTDRLTKYKKGSKICEPCKVIQVEIEAEAFCVDCAEFLCVECISDHRKNKLSREHIVLERKDRHEDFKVFKTMKSMVSCQYHPEEEVSYRCEEHREFICKECFVTDHRKCENIKALKSVTPLHENESNKAAIIDKLNNVHVTTVSTRERKEKNVKLLLETQKKLKQERDCAMKHLDKISQQLEEEIENLVMKEKSALQNDIEMCKALEKEEEQNKELVENVMKSENAVWLKVVYELVDKNLDPLEEKTDVLRKKEPVSLQFRPNSNFQTLKQISSLGEVQMIHGEAPAESVINDKETKLQYSSDAVEEI